MSTALRLLAFSLLIALAGCGNGTPAAPSGDQRLAVGDCHNVRLSRSSAPDKLERVCFIPLVRLIAMPDAFVGVGVGVSGVLLRTPPGFTAADWELYLDHDSLERHDRASAIQIRGDIGLADVPQDPNVDYQAPVLVVGRFEAPDDPTYVGKLVLLRDVWHNAAQ